VCDDNVTAFLTDVNKRTGQLLLLLMPNGFFENHIINNVAIPRHAHVFLLIRLFVSRCRPCEVKTPKDYNLTSTPS